MVRFFAQEGMLMGISLEVCPAQDFDPDDFEDGWYRDVDGDVCYVARMPLGGFAILYVQDGKCWYAAQSPAYNLALLRPCPAFTLRYTP